MTAPSAASTHVALQLIASAAVSGTARDHRHTLLVVEADDEDQFELGFVIDKTSIARTSPRCPAHEHTQAMGMSFTTIEVQLLAGAQLSVHFIQTRVSAAQKDTARFMPL